MLAEITIDVNGINVAYGLVLLTVFYLVVSNIASVLKMLRGLAMAGWHMIVVHKYVAKGVLGSLHETMSGLLVCFAIIAGVYIGNYHFAGPDFDLWSYLFAIPVGLVLVFLALCLLSIYIEAGQAYYTRNMGDKERDAYHKSRKCERKWDHNQTAPYRKVRGCRNCELNPYCKVGLKILEND